MFKEDQLAAAQLAQIFGSELLKVQNSAQTDSGQAPDIVKMDPKQFLVGSAHYASSKKAEERRMIEALQREAEAACPLPQEQTYTPQTAPAAIPPQSAVPPRPVPVNKPPVQTTSISQQSSDVLERIALSLERIANAVDKVEIKTKKKTLKRSNKPKINKPILLNETTA